MRDTIFPRGQVADNDAPPLASGRLASGVPGLDELLRGGPLERSATLVTGAPGTGKSLLGAQFVIEGGQRAEPGLLVCLEESAKHVIRAADKLGLPLGQLSDSGIVEVLFVPREHIQVGQFLDGLTDRIRPRRVQRLVIDSLNSVIDEHLPPADLRPLLRKLILAFKELGTTTLLTMDAARMLEYSTSELQDISQVADYVIDLRYSELAGSLRRTLILMTRDSAHDMRGHPYAIGRGGLRLDHFHEEPAPAEQPRRTGAEPPQGTQARPRRSIKRG